MERSVHPQRQMAMNHGRRLQRHAAPLIVIAASLLLAACATTGDATPTDSRTRPPTVDPSETQPGEVTMPMGGLSDDTLADLVAAAAADAGVDIDEISIVTAEQVTWRDGAIGCPEPGMMYTQALTPGYRVVLEIDGEDHHFHASETGEFFYCDDPEPPAEGGTR